MIVKLKNTSTNVDITEIVLSIGNVSYNFDAAYNVIGGAVGSWLLVGLDTNDLGGLRSDLVKYTFTGFNPDEVFQFSADFDRDNIDNAQDYRTILFNNGNALNAALTVKFSNNMSLTQILADSAMTSSYTFAQSQPVPLPSAFILFSFGLLSFSAKGYIKKKS